MSKTFKEIIDDDIPNTFMTDMAQKAIYSGVDGIKEIDIHFFDEALDQLNTVYLHAWCANNLIPRAKTNDTLTIDGVVYGIVDLSPDEFHSGINLFLQKV